MALCVLWAAGKGHMVSTDHGFSSGLGRSVKARLIDALEREVIQREQMLWTLRNRGSGPLPRYLVREAEKRGLARVSVSGPV